MTAAPDPTQRPLTEASNPATARLDACSTRELVERLNDEDARVAPAVRRVLDAVAASIDAIAARVAAGGRLIYVGAGTSGRLGVLDAAECGPTFGAAPGQVIGVLAGGDAALVRAREGAEDEEAPARERLRELGVGARDAVVGISAGGRTPFVRAALEAARAAGALTIALACTPEPAIAHAADLVIAPLTGPEAIAGSTRLKAGSATKLVLNMLSTGLFVRLGRVRGNAMVDLRPGSRKLVERARRIVAELGGVDEARAAELLARHGGSVRAALDELASSPQAPAVARSGAGSGWVAGIDGGGTKTAVLLAPPPGVDARTAPLRLAQPCQLAHDLDGAVTTIVEAIEAASALADRPGTPLAALVVGAAGAGDAALRARASAALRARGIAERIAILHDAAPLLAAASPERRGVALISGTGSFCFGRDGAGRCARAGGLGALLGDDGSAYELGRAALRAAARAADGRAAKLALVRAVFAAIGGEDARDVVRFAWAARGSARIAELAALVPQATEAGDPVAQRLVARAAGELALMAKTVARQLDFGGAVPLLLAGGVFDHAPALRRRVVSALQEMGIAPDVLPSGEPAAGAVALARDLLAGRLDEASWFPAADASRAAERNIPPP